MHVLADIKQAKFVRSITPNRLGAVSPALFIIGQRLRRLITPRKKLSIYAAARGPLPFRFAWQAIVLAADLRQPLAVLCGLKPRDCDHRLLRMIEAKIIPGRRWLDAASDQKCGILGLRHLARSHFEGIYPNAVHRLLAVESLVRTHLKPAFGNPHQFGCNEVVSSFFRLHRAAETLLPSESSFAASLSACCRLCR